MSTEKPENTMAKARAAVMAPKGGRPTILTEEVHVMIVGRIQQGCFAWIAAQAAGIPRDTYAKWITRGKVEWAEYEAAHAAWEEGGKQGEEPLPSCYALLSYDVATAAAKARTKAEVKVMEENPLAWLLKGPGRHKPGEEGWADKLELTGNVSNAPAPAIDQAALATLSDEDLAKLEDIHAKLAAAGGAAAAAPRQS